VSLKFSVFSNLKSWNFKANYLAKALESFNDRNNLRLHKRWCVNFKDIKYRHQYSLEMTCFLSNYHVRGRKFHYSPLFSCRQTKRTLSVEWKASAIENEGKYFVCKLIWWVWKFHFPLLFGFITVLCDSKQNSLIKISACFISFYTRSVVNNGSCSLRIWENERVGGKWIERWNELFFWGESGHEWLSLKLTESMAGNLIWNSTHFPPMSAPVLSPT
jgi:hypothetical protein